MAPLAIRRCNHPQCPNCGSNCVGIRNEDGNCFATLSAYFAISNETLLNQLAQYNVNQPNYQDAVRFRTILLDLVAQRDANLPLQLDAYLNAINFNPFNVSGNYCWNAFENLLRKLESFGLAEMLQVYNHPCPCGGHLREADMPYVDLIYRRTFESSVRNRIRFSHLQKLPCPTAGNAAKTVRDNVFIMRNFPRFLGFKFSDNADMDIPMQFKLANQYIVNELHEQNVNVVYNYRGHAVKEAVEGTDFEHNVSFVLWKGLIHKINDIEHLVADLPNNSFWVSDIDFVIYEKQVIGT